LKALIVRLSSIGDVIHTLPVLHALHASGFTAGWVVQPAARTLLEGQPLLQQLVIAPPTRGFRLPGARAAVARLRAEHYDVALDFQGLWKSVAWARASGAARVVGFGAGRREPLSSLLVSQRVSPPAGSPHVIDRNLALLGALGIDAVGQREFPLPPASPGVADALARLGLGDYVVLNPGGGWRGKLWTPEGFGTLARHMAADGLRSLVTWGPGEEALADRVVAASFGAAVRCFPTSLPELAEVLRRARLMVAADTGPLHLACAVRTPVVAIFGPTDPERNGPFAAADRVVRRVPPCAPCYSRRCRRHEGVLAALAVSDVLAAARQRLGTPLRSACG